MPNNLPKWYDTSWYMPGGDSVVIPDSNWVHDSTQFMSGTTSKALIRLSCHAFGKVSPRRLNPDREFHAISYVWKQ